MPSPVGHVLAGLTVHALLARDRRDLWDPARATLAMAAAVLADIDLAFKFVDGRSHHSGETHSLGAALTFGILVAITARVVQTRKPWSLGLLAGGAWCTHIVLDYLNVDTSTPVGILALWPFSDGWYKFSHPIFSDIWRSFGWAAVRHNLEAMGLELLILLPLLLLAVWWRARGQPTVERAR